VVRYNPADSSLVSVLEEEYSLLPGTTKPVDNLDCIAVTSADDLIVVWNRYDTEEETFYLEIERVSPQGDRTTMLTTSGGGQGVCHLAVDATSGDLFLLEGRAGASPNWSGIRRFSPNGSGYTETTITTAGSLHLGLAIGPDGYLYSFDASVAYGEFEILRIDPDGFDSWTVHATAESSPNGRRFKGWGWDGGGGFWMAIDDFKVKKGVVTNFAYVAPIPPGGTVRARNRIGETSGGWCLALNAGPGDELYYIEEIAGSPIHTVFSLSPSGDEGGNGGGKGKKK
jgi:hypothetical protein